MFTKIVKVMFDMSSSVLSSLKHEAQLSVLDFIKTLKSDILLLFFSSFLIPEMFSH